MYSTQIYIISLIPFHLLCNTNERNRVILLIEKTVETPTFNIEPVGYWMLNQ